LNSVRKKALPSDDGPRKWLIPVLESAYSKLVPRDQVETDKHKAKKLTPSFLKRQKLATKRAPLTSNLQPGKGDEVLAEIPRDFWEKKLREYQQRKVSTISRMRTMVLTEGVIPPPGMPAVPGANNWVPIGPSVVARGQPVGRPSIAGRVSRIAIASGGLLMYCATANGGIFRSDDGGKAWRSMMDGFDLDPTNFASTSLACGAVAVSPTDCNRVYVGTGEGDTDALFSLRLTNALPAYRGIGPIRSDDGGDHWITESSSPSLAGYAFYDLAIDPANHNNVIGATTNGLYQRTLGSSGPTWQQRQAGNHCSVVVARSGSTTTFYAAKWGGPVYVSTNGSSWNTVGTVFPSSNVGRVALGVQRDNPNILYALVSNSSGGLLGIFRLDGGSGTWHNISGTPNILPGSQGDYDLCIAVDPNNSNRIYIAGDSNGVSPYPANIQRCIVSSSGTSYSMTSTSIGVNAHADVHTLTFPPGDPNNLWTGTDGGCYLNSNPTSSSVFEGRNTGLSSLCTNYMGMSPSEPAVVYCGLQDNGTCRYLGEELWRHVLFGDGGYCVVHPTDPTRVLAYANGSVYLSVTGAHDYPDWTSVLSPPWAIMAEPLIAAPASERVAFGAGSTVYISDDFGATWPTSSRVTLSLGGGGIYSMIFANNVRMFVGTTNGRVYRLDLTSGIWSATQIDNASGGSLPLSGLVSDIAIDWSDATRQSVFICFGGTGDFRHVWYFNGTNWQARSGVSGTSNLLDVEHNAIVVDPANPSNVYVGADLGVWSSTNNGNSWSILQNGLPDAPVFDLQIHGGARLLRASTHGRGLYEYRLDSSPLSGIELYLRDTMLDTARGENTDGRNDPSQWPVSTAAHWRSPNIKVDVPTPAGYQTPTNQINFFQFHEVITDGSNGVATIDPPLVVHNRVYVLAHNRGPLTAASVRVTAVITNASTVLSPLPAGYTANVQLGTSLPGPDWQTLGSVVLNNLRPGFPQVVAFDLPSNMLPLPASLPGQSHFCLLSFVHSTADPFTATETNPDVLTIHERKVAQRNLHIVQFAGTPPVPGAGTGTWARLDVTGFLFKEKGSIDLVLDLKGFPGSLYLLIPNDLLPLKDRKSQKDFVLGSKTITRKWYKQYSQEVERLYWEGKYDKADYEHLMASMKKVSNNAVIQPRSKSTTPTLTRISLTNRRRYTIFIRIDPPKNAQIGQSWSFSITQRDSRTGTIQGGADYGIYINKPLTKSALT